MPFTWQININKTATGYTYDPNPLPQVATGDQVIWTNNDDQAHWPGLVSSSGVDQTYFMAFQIAPHSPSTTFVPGVDGTLVYVDSLDPAGPQGSIQVGTQEDIA